MRSKALLFVMIAVLLVSCRSTIPAADLETMPRSLTYTSAGDYRLGPGDEVRLKVVGDPTFDGAYFVSDKGQLLLPVLGPVNVAMLTEPELHQQLDKQIANYVKGPSTSAQIVSKRSFKAFFSGEFARVGMQQFEDRVSVLAAISMAGGLTPFASGRIVIARGGGAGATEVKRYATTYRALQTGSVSLDQVYVERGDIIIAE